ncbi:MAG: hypothetical protein AB3N20_15755 [Rhizobiaceae bacterium]
MSANKPVYSIRFEGAGIQAQAMVQTMLQVDAVHVTADWVIADTPRIGVEIYDSVFDGAAGQNVYCARALTAEGECIAESKLPNPFRLMQFVEFINNAETSFERYQALLPETTAVPQVPADSMSAGSAGMRDVVQGDWLALAQQLRAINQVPQTSGYLSVSIDSFPVATIDLGNNTYRRHANIRKLLAHTNVINSIRSHEDSGPQAATDVILPSDNFLWIAGLMAGNGRPVPWCPPDQAYLLKRWPNFSVLNHNMKMIEMAATMTRRPIRPKELSLISQTGEAQVWNFINAVSLLGLVEARVPEEPLTAQAPQAKSANGHDGVSTLLNKLRKRFAQVA